MRIATALLSMVVLCGTLLGAPSALDLKCAKARSAALLAMAASLEEPITPDVQPDKPDQPDQPDTPTPAPGGCQCGDWCNCEHKRTGQGVCGAKGCVKPQEYIDPDFKVQELVSTLPQVYIFTAPWCQYCKVLHAPVDALKKAGWRVGPELDNSIVVVNTDADPATTQKFNVNLLPTVIVVKEGVEVKRLVGPECKQLDAFKIGAFVTNP